jgi:hypothetical protein
MKKPLHLDLFSGSGGVPLFRQRFFALAGHLREGVR